MNYSIVVWGFDTDNDYCHECDIIKAKNMSEAFSLAVNVIWKGWTFTRIDIEELKENRYIVRYFDNEIHEEYHYNCKADSELAAKVKFRLQGDFADTKRYTIISVKGVKK